MAEVKDSDPLTTTTSSEEKPTEISIDNSSAIRDKNAVAAADVKNLLAELQAEGSLDKPDEHESNGVGKVEEPEVKAIADPKKVQEKSEANALEKAEALEAEQAEVKREEQPGAEEPLREQGSNYTEKEYDSRDRKTGYGRGSSSRGHHNNRGGKKEYRDFQANVKTDYEKLEESSDPVKIRKQVEFYFSDSNLPNDKHMLLLVGGSKNNPVELSKIHSFKRMRHFQPFSAIVAALKESSVLELVDDDTAVKRKVPLPSGVTDTHDPEVVRVFEDKTIPRSIYAKGFGDEEPSTQFDIEAFFGDFGSTNQVRLRRTGEKIFKGSVFVEFENEGLQKKFLTLDPKPKFKGKDLQIMSKKQYCDGKAEDIAAGRIQKNNKSHYIHPDRDGKRKTGYGRDDRNWKERREDDQKSGFQGRNRDRDGNRRYDGYKGRGGGRGGSRRNDRDSREAPKLRITSESEHPNFKPKESTSTTASDKQDPAKAQTETAPAPKEEPASPKRKREDDETEPEKPAKKIDVGNGRGEAKDETVIAEAKTEITAS